MALNEIQHARLLLPIDPSRVLVREGMSYVNQADVRRWLIRVFGFGGFNVTSDEADLISVRDGQGKSGANFEVVWKVRCTLAIPALGASYSEYAIGTASMPNLPKAHDTAIKAGESDALKRCAVNLGDQFGLSLYFSKDARQPVLSSVHRVLSEGNAEEAVAQDAPMVEEEHISADLAARTAPPATDPTQERQDALPDPAEVAAALGGTVVEVPTDFWSQMCAIMGAETPAKRLKLATAYRQELDRLGVDKDFRVLTPTGTPITVGVAFDTAIGG